MSDALMPAAHAAADAASLRGQRHLRRLYLLELACLVMAALCSAAADVGRSWVIAAAAFLGVGIVATLLIRFLRLQEDWYQGRAVAESVKSLAWLFMLRAGPFAGDDGEARSSFLDTVEKVLKSFPDLRARLRDAGAVQITPAMQAARALPAQERAASYLRERIEEQRRWYESRAAANDAAGTRWFALVLGAELLALVLAGVTLARPEFGFHATGLLATLATAFLAWTRFRNHRELRDAYRVAAQELGLIRERAAARPTDAELARFVEDAENAISREHTLWLARRGASPRT